MVPICLATNAINQAVNNICTGVDVIGEDIKPKDMTRHGGNHTRNINRPMRENRMTRRREKALVMCTIVYNSLKVTDVTRIQSDDLNYVAATSVERLQTLKSIHQMMKIVEYKCIRTDHKQDTISNREEGSLYIG